MSISSRTKDGKKEWRAVVSVYDVYGKRHQKTSAWYTRKSDAAEAESRLKAEQANERIGKTFGEVCMEWIMATKEQNIRKTHLDKIHMLNFYLAPIKNMKLDRIHPATLQKLFREPDFLELGTSRRNRVRGIVSSTFKHAMRMYSFPSNPCEAIPTFGKTDEEKLRKRVVYTPEQFRLAIDQVDPQHKEHKSVLVVLYLSGMRLNECLSLTFKDFADKSVHIWKQSVRGEWHVLKTDGSERTIQLPKAALDIIQQQYEYYSNLPAFSPDWYIFGGPKKIPETSLRRVFDLAQEAAGLPHTRLHDLRHAHASVLLENMKGEGDILKVSKRLGHSSVTTTLQIYAHVLNQSEDDVVNILDALF